MSDGTKAYEQPKCRSCGAEINFVQAKNKAGIIKAHPVNKDGIFILCSTGEKDEKGKYIYGYKKGYLSHFATCPNAAEHRNTGTGQQAAAKPDQTAEDLLKKIAEDDKPPF